MAGLLQLVGKHLKDDEVIDLLEGYDLDVIYDFDRLHENAPDEYRVEARKQGFCLRANDAQRIKTIFCYIQSREGYDPVDANDCGCPLPQSANEGLTVLGVPSRTGTDWRRFDFSTHALHYTWNASGLCLVCMMLPSAVPKDA
jgi:hypothetical protein